jgi:hypothetical protein
MAGDAYLRYSNRTVTKRAGGRYDLVEMWIVPGIENTAGGDTNPETAWQNEALEADGLPEIGDINQDGGYVCTSLTPRSLDDQGTAYVDVRWQEDPLTLRTEVHYFSMSKTKPAWRGAGVPSGLPPGLIVPGIDVRDVRNSAGDRYNPPVTYEMGMERIEITFHASLKWHDEGRDWSKYLKHWNKSDYTVKQWDPDNPDNSSERTFPEGSLMFVDKRAPLVKEPFFHRLVTCVFLYDPDLWGMRLPDMGPRCRKYIVVEHGTCELRDYPARGIGTVTDCFGRPFSGPAELDGEGGQLLPDVDGHMPPAKIYQWWPVDDDDNLFSAEFDDLELFLPERSLSV